MADIHDGLRGRVKHQNVGSPGELLVLRHHGNRVDDRRGIEHGLQHHFPDMGHITEIHIQRAQKQGNAETKAIQLDDAERNQQDAPGVMRVGEETEEDDHHKVDAQEIMEPIVVDATMM